MDHDEPIHAPEFRPGLTWFNVSRPLSMKSLRGKMVLLDFWTYGCINCMHVIPDLKKLEAKYGSKLAVIGVHSPKFANERNPDTLRKIIARYGLKHPVVNDTEFTMWRECGVRAWPTLILVDPDGYILGGVSGEGHYDILDKYIGETLEQFSGKIDDSPLPQANETFPARSILDSPGKITANRQFVAISDTLHHRVLITGHEGRVLQIYGGIEPGFADGDHETCRFHGPQGLCFGPRQLYVADTGNHALRAIDLETGNVATIAGNGEKEWRNSGRFPARQIGLTSPWDLLVYNANLYVAMAGTHQVWRMSLEDGTIGPYAGSGREDIIDGPVGRAAFSQPSGLSMAGYWLYVADAEDSAIRRIDMRPGAQSVETLTGTGLFDFGDQDGPRRTALIQHPLGVAALDERRALFTDTYNHKLKLIDLDADSVTTLAGNGMPGNGSQLNEPGGICLIDSKALISDTNNNRIVQYDLEKGVLTEWPVTIDQAI